MKVMDDQKNAAEQNKISELKLQHDQLEDEFDERMRKVEEQNDEIIKKLKERNESILKRYNGDVKYAYVHKRIREENAARSEKNRPLIISKYDDDIVEALCYIKNAVDDKVYDRNDILKQDAYFSQTVLQQIALSLQKIKGILPTSDDYNFIKMRVAKQYIDQYNQYYSA